VGIVSVSQRVSLWAAAVISFAVVLVGALRLVIIAVASNSPGIDLPDRAVLFSEDRGGATLVRQQVLATATGPAWVDALAIGAEVVDVVMIMVVAGIFAALSVGLARGAVFTRLLARAMGAASVVIIVGSIVNQTLKSVAHSALVDQLAATDAGEMLTTSAFTLDYDLLPIAGGLVLALLATAFARAARLQDDSSGLV